MQLYKRNGVYQVTYQSGDGKQVRRSLKTRNKRLADKLIAKLCLDLYESTLSDKEPPRGFLELMMHYLEAKQQARANIEILAPFAREGIPILGLEPSCILCFADDYLDLIDHPDAARVAEQAMMLEDFVVQVIREGTELSFTQRRKQILVHGHCHQKALVGMAATVEVLNLPFGYEAAEINSGCCGMAGSFGYETEHYEISMKVGEQRLFRAIREADEEVEVAAVGTSCRHQIADATGRRARHWAEILVEAL